MPEEKVGCARPTGGLVGRPDPSPSAADPLPHEQDEHELSKMVEGGVPFAMLSDAGGKVGTAYGVYDEDAGVENRGRFLIDPDGVIQAYEVLTPPVGRHVAETLRQIEAFQLVRASKGGKATPSGWKPGRPVLEPGPELVGRVWEVWKPEMARN